MGIKDEVVDVALFIINVVPTWATDIVWVLIEGALYLNN